MSGQLPKHEVQLINEQMYSRKFIDGYLRQEIADNPESEAKVQYGIQLINDWLGKDYYPSKNARLAQLKGIDVDQLVRDVFVFTCYCQVAQMFTSVTAQLAAKLGFDDKKDAIQTVAEIIAVLCLTDAYDIMRSSNGSSLIIQSTIPLSDKLVKFAEQTHYLPPMVCQPQELTHNAQSGYLTHDDTLILGRGNHHNGDICLDVLNKFNSVALSLNTEFLSNVEEEPTFDLDSVKDQASKTFAQVQQEIRHKRDQWNTFKSQSHEVYKLMVGQGNRFYLTHKPDMRGRVYCQGYHITYQGTSYKKAMIDLANKEVVEGVPT